MASVLETVNRFRTAFYGGDTATARDLLADDFVFTGPAVTIRGPDNFIKASRHVVRGLEAVEIRKSFAEGSDVCIIFNMVIDHKVGRMEVVDWYHLRGGRIASIWSLFDMAPFVAQSTGVEESGSLDPVCHMRIEESTAAATCTHEGKTYHFCSEACAQAFGANPDRYLLVT